MEIYRACVQERQLLVAAGAAIRPTWHEGQLKSALAGRSETVRVQDGRWPADAERHRVVEELELPLRIGAIMPTTTVGCRKPPL